MLERFKVPDTDKVYIQSEKIFELTKNILKDLNIYPVSAIEEVLEKALV